MTFPSPQNGFEELEKSLSLLGNRLMEKANQTSEETLHLAEAFHAWAKIAAETCGAWSLEMVVLSKKIITGAQDGRPVAEVLKRLSKAMTEASQSLEFEMAGFPEPAEAQSPETKQTPQDEGFFNVPADDLAGFKDFLGEAPEHLQAIEHNLLSLSRSGSWDVLQVYRAFHTLKGVSGFMGLNQLASLAHRAEAQLEPFKQGQGKPSEDQVDWLLQACDLVREQVQAIAQGLPSSRFRVLSFAHLNGEENLAGSKAVLTPSIPGFAAQPMEPADKAEGQVDNSHGRVGDASIRIGVEKMDALLEVVGELAICQTQVWGGVEALGLTGHLPSEVGRLGKISRQLQDIVLSLRMVPVQPLFLRMSRLARDLSRKTGKPLVLELEGSETEIDRRMVEELVEPLVHLIRNAVDHGLETPEERGYLGKNPEACLKLTARHQGGDFVMELSDDGRGLDYEKLLEKARQWGLVNDREKPSEEWLSELIFKPGFSTAEKITEVSGRGVGLDAVKRKLQSLKGSVRVTSQSDKGTVFCLRIPLTLALMDGILVRVGKTRYVLPAFQVVGFTALLEAEEHSIGGGRKWLTTAQEHLPLIDLQESLGLELDHKLKPVVVQVETMGRKACLVVDEVLGKQQVVIKELGENLRDLEGVTGGAILGDGKVGLILDLAAFLETKASTVIAN